ncbi:MAG: ATP-binding protein [Bacteroidota bacterium]
MKLIKLFLFFSFLSGNQLYAQTIIFHQIDESIVEPNWEINQIHQCNNGLVLLGSTKGLYLYDGARAEQITNPEYLPNGILGTSIMSPFYERSDGIVWFGTDEGIVSFNPTIQEFSSYLIKESKNKPPHYILSLQEDKYLWVSLEGSLYVLDLNKPEEFFEAIPKYQSMASIGGIVEDSQGNQWIATSAQIDPGLDLEPAFESNEETQLNYKLEILDSSVIREIVRGESGHTYLRSREHLFDITNGESNTLEMDKLVFPLDQLLFSFEGKSLYILSRRKGLWKLQGKNIIKTQTNLDEILSNDDSNKRIHLSQNASENKILWLFIPNKGLFSSNLNAKYPSNLSERIQSSAGNLFYAENGQLIIDGPSENNYAINLKKNDIKKVYPKKGKILGINEDSCFIFDGSEITLLAEATEWTVSGGLDTLKNVGPVGRLGQEILIKHRKGLIGLNIHNHQLHNYDNIQTYVIDAEILPNNRLAVIDASGNLTLHNIHEEKSENSYRTNSDPIIKYSLSKAHDTITGLHIVNQLAYDDNRNVLWIAGIQGLYSLDIDNNLKHFTEKEGLPFTVLTGILIDKNGSLWLSGGGGIATFIPEDSLEFSKFHFRAGKGISNNEYKRAKNLVTPDGNFWFISKTGIDFFNPDNLQEFRNPPNPVLRELFVLQEPYRNKDGKSVHKLNSITLPYDQNTLSFKLAAPEYTDPEGVEFYVYWVNGQNDTTTFDLGTDPDFELFNQPPDRYQFGFTAKSAQGVWAEEPYWMSITINPHWSQTGWFRLLLLAMGISLAALITRVYYRYRLRVQEAQLAEERRLSDLREAELKRRIDLEEQRRQITARIHNEVGGNLTTISMLSSRIDKANELDKTKTLNERITQRVRETRRRFSSFLRAINPQFDELDKTLQLVRSDTAEMLQDNALQASFDWPDDIPDRRISPDFRLGFFEIVREVINNIMKSANAQHLHLKLELPENKRLELSILDDGDGFSPTPEDFTKGIGLSSLQQISKELGGSLTYELRPEGGTKTHISLPLPISETNS